MNHLRRTAPPLLGLALAAGLTANLSTGLPAASAHAGPRPTTYELTGDADSPVGSKFEGIGADQRRGVFYVSEVTGGEIHRGSARSPRTAEWVAGDGTDGRFTARGITVDAAGRVYVAGGPNGIGTGRPDLWVYAPDGALLAALRAPGTDVFLNDVTIGADGAAYFTNSNDPQVFRVALGGDGAWRARLWADARGTIERREGFNLGGIVLSADRSALVVAQGSTGRLWRFASRTGAVSEVSTHGARRFGRSGGIDTNLVNADGLLRQGNRLTVVRNFSRMVATLQLSADGRRALVLRQAASSPERVLTTVAALSGRRLYVDSKFDEQVASGPYQVVTDPTR